MGIVELEHVQLNFPPGELDRARTFFREVLGMREVERPVVLHSFEGAWFFAGAARLHLAVDPEFTPVRRGHPAFVVDDLQAMEERCRAAGCDTSWGDDVPGFRRFFVCDPFGNRIELMGRTD